jgi:hypothetical protein
MVDRLARRDRDVPVPQPDTPRRWPRLSQIGARSAGRRNRAPNVDAHCGGPQRAPTCAPSAFPCPGSVIGPESGSLGCSHERHMDHTERMRGESGPHSATVSPEALRVGRVKFSGRVSAHPLCQTLASRPGPRYPARAISDSTPISSQATAVSLGVGTWRFGRIPGGNAWKHLRLSRYARYRVWCAWRQAGGALLCHLASDSHRQLRRLHCNRCALSREIPVFILYAAKSPSVKDA